MTDLLLDFARLDAFARDLADAARSETLPRWQGGWTADDKNEGGIYDPVTEADRGAELAMRTLIEAHYPDHGIAGEEFPDRPAQGRYTWSLDPIDGTRSFICGLPTWVTLIALLDDGEPVLGLIDAPRLGERYIGYGELGRLSTPAGDSGLRTSGCNRLAEARLSTTDPFLFAGAEAEGFDRVRGQSRTTRFGHDGYGYARLAAGSLDLVIESGLKPFDYNALIPVVRAAGGAIGDWQGGQDFGPGRIVAAASQSLYDEAVALLHR
jgi:histidinol phosphatase-like enzyme (inositol monophosphatase family)